METLLRAGLSNAVAATLMAMVAAGLSRPLARRPAVLHGLWLLVLIKLVTPPLYDIPIPMPPATVEAADPSVGDDPADLGRIAEVVVFEEAAVDPPDGPPPSRIERGLAVRPGPPSQTPSGGLLGALMIGLDLVDPPAILATIWMAGTAVVLLVAFRRIRRFQKLLEEAKDASCTDQDWVDAWAERLGVRRAPRLGWVPGRVSPMIWFAGHRPRLIVPQELWATLDAGQRSTLVAHELAHLRRGDHLVRLLELLATALYWWHPLVWWMRGSLRDVEEQCCDAWVVWALPDAARVYAETLLDTLEFLRVPDRPEPVLASGLGKAHQFRRRLTMIMTGNSRRTPGLAGRLGLLLAAVVMLPAGAGWAQKSDKSKEVRVVVLDETRPTTTLPVDVAQADSATVDLQVTTDGQGARSVSRPGYVTVQLDGVNARVAGPLQDVMKMLQDRIAKLRAEGERSEAAKARIKALTDALEAIKKEADAEKSVIVVRTNEIRTDHPRSQTPGFRVGSRIVASSEEANEIAKVRGEVEKLKADLKATVAHLTEAQARLRQLGEDAGEVPVVEWRAKPAKRVEYKMVVRPVNPTGKPLTSSDRKAQLQLYMDRAVDAYRAGRFEECLALVAKAQSIEPNNPQAGALAFKAKTQRERDERLGEKRAKGANGDLPSANRLDALEKQLKDLQDQFDRMKKQPANTGEKK